MLLNKNYRHRRRFAHAEKKKENILSNSTIFFLLSSDLSMGTKTRKVRRTLRVFFPHPLTKNQRAKMLSLDFTYFMFGT
jgi:hypothetical protein